MSGFGFLCLTREAGPAAWDLCADVAGLARPGDRVVIVDDGGDPANAAWTGRFAAMRGFGAGVAVSRIVTGVRGAGDAGLATNLALDCAAADPGLAQVLILPGRARLDGPGFAAARALVDAGDPALVLAPARLADRATGWRGEAALAATLPPPHPGRMILARRLFAGPKALRAAEGCSAGGDLGLAWRAMARGLADPGGLARSPAVIATLPRPATPDAAWLEAAADLLRMDGGSPALHDWLWQALTAGLAGAAPGAVLALAAPLVAFARACPPPAGTDPATLLRPSSPSAPPSAPPQSAPPQTGSPQTGPPQTGSPQTGPSQTGRAALRVACLGPHRHRMPLAYPALAPLWEGRLAAAAPEAADLVIFAHPQDPLTLDAATARAIAGRTAVLFSEEPFWDSLFSPDPLAPLVTLRAAHLGQVTVHQRNHHTSAVFAWDRLPYLTLTEPRFAAAYARLFARNAALTPEDWRRAFAARPLQAAFMAERRPEAFHDLALPGGDVVGLCAWRTRLAEGYATGRVARLGASWQGGPARFDLADWHADKLDRLDGQARLISAIENTHQPAYVSEKLFDAFACGARPLYLASPGHRMRDLGLPPQSWINLWGLSSAEAPAAIDSLPWDAEFAAAYTQAQAHLARLWSDAGLIAAERARIGRAVLADLQRLADLGPA